MKQENLPIIVAVMGNDDGLVQEESAHWFETLKGKTDPFNHEVIDGNVATVDEVGRVMRSTMDALMTPPFFAGQKVVWLKACSFAGDSPLGKSHASLEALERLLDFLKEGLPEGVYFLFSSYEINRRRGLYKFFTKSCHTLEFEKPDVSREGWEGNVRLVVEKQAKKRKLKFEPEAMALFVNRVSESSRQIFNELDKLDLYLGAERRLVTVEDITLMVPLTRTGVIFEINRALVKRDVQRVLALIERELEKDDSPISIMRAAVIPTFRNLYMASVLVKGFTLPMYNYTAFTEALTRIPEKFSCLIPKKKDGSPSAYPLFLATQQLSSFSHDWLRQSLLYCFEADKALVTTAQESRVILHKLIVRLCSRKIS